MNEEQKIDLIQKNFVFDNTGDNISHLNKWLGDLTGLYWIWKNTNDEFVGTNQYRRFWDDTQLNSLQLNPNTLYVTYPLSFPCSAYDQYASCSSDLGLVIIKDLAQKKIINVKPEFVDQLRTINYIFPCNMFIAHRELFDKVCQMIFEMVFEIYEGTKYCLPFIQRDAQTRMVAYLAERLLTIMYNNKNYYFNNVEITPILWRNFDDI